jgi:hypothetical protein
MGLNEELQNRLNGLFTLASSDLKAQLDLKQIFMKIALAEGQALARAGHRAMPMPYRICKCKAIYESNGFPMCPICQSKQTEAQLANYRLEVWIKDKKSPSGRKFTEVRGYGYSGAVGLFGTIALKRKFTHWVSEEPLLGYYENDIGEQLYVKPCKSSKK